MKKFILPVVLALPLSQPQWEMLKYSSIPSHELSFAPSELRIKVKSSAAPIIHKLKAPMTVKEVRLKASMVGKINYGGKTPGEKGADDFPLRIGLVVAGDKRLGTFQSAFAPAWIVRLHELAPAGTG